MWDKQTLERLNAEKEAELKAARKKAAIEVIDDLILQNISSHHTRELRNVKCIIEDFYV